MRTLLTSLALLTVLPAAALAGPAPRSISVKELEQRRIAGTPRITPDAATQAKLVADGKARIHGSWKVCLDTSGAVTAATALQSTGYAAYDARIETEIETSWRYQPYIVEGNAVAVCSDITFVYATK